MDPIVGQLNKVAQNKISKTDLMPQAPGMGSNKIESKFDNKMTEKLMDSLKESMSPKNEVNVLSAKDIQLNAGQIETQNVGPTTKVGDMAMNMFKQVNKDMVGLDAAIDTLTNPSITLTPRQLLSIQAGVANTQVFVQGFVNFVDLVGKSVQNITSMQV